MQDQERILSFLRATGPTLPSKVAKSIRSEILIASAHLSDLAAQGKVKISHLKVGGSPLYYLAGQEAQLLNFAQENLNPKDIRVLSLLREKGILRESSLELFSKVSLRSLKDFATPMQVTVGNQKELFWRWHLLSTEEFNQRISEVISDSEPKPLSEKTSEKESSHQPARPEFTISVGNVLAGSPEWPELNNITVPSPPSQKQDAGHKVTITERKSPEKPVPEKLVSEIPVPKKAVEPIPLTKEKQTSLHGIESRFLVQKVRETIKEPVRAVKEFIREAVREPAQEVRESAREPVKEQAKALVKERKRRTPGQDNFLLDLEGFFSRLKIDLEQKEMVRKNAEYNFVIKVPSVVGKVTYYCKAKKKAKCDEKDLSTAYMEAQIKKLPLLFLYPKELNRKALELLNSGAFENLVVKRME